MSYYLGGFIDENGKYVNFGNPTMYGSPYEENVARWQELQRKRAQPQAVVPPPVPVSGGGTALQAGALGTGGNTSDLASSIASALQMASAKADPWAEQRGQYVTQLNQLMQGGVSAVAADPSVQARQRAGQDALARSLAARGFLGSGNILEELQSKGQEIASQEYGNQFNRLAMLAGVQAGSPGTAASIMAQIPGQQLSAQQQAFTQGIQQQKLPYELTALQQGSQLKGQEIASGDLQQQMLQQQMNAMRDAQNRLSLIQNQANMPRGFLA
jgi:hypothetical protein